MCQIVKEWKSWFFDKSFSKTVDFYYQERSLYPCITDIGEGMSTLNQEGHNHNKVCVTVEMYRKT